MKYPIKTIFMGTPAFVLPAFEVLVKDERFDVVACYTQPDRPVGRSGAPLPPPVKVRAQKHDVPVYQPEKIGKTTIEQIRMLNPDLIIVFAYSQILPKELLDIPKYKCVNIHPSLLPRWRGASPITFAILEGDEKAGVSYMLMDEKLDHGPIIKQFEIQVSDKDDAESLLKNLSKIAADNLAATLIDYIEGHIKPKPQDHGQAVYSRTLSREDARIDFTKPAIEIERQVRALRPWPGTYFEWDNRRIKVLDLRLSEDEKLESGHTKKIDDKLLIGTGQGNIELKIIQPEGKKEMDVIEFLNGNPSFADTILK